MARGGWNMDVAVTGDEAVARALTEKGGRGKDARPIWPPIMRALQKDTAHRFDSKDDGHWPALAASTIRSKKVTPGYDNRIMRASGALHRSLTADRAKGGVRRRAKTKLTYGTNLPYAHYHETGTPGGKIPKRELVAVDPRVTKRAGELIAHYVATGAVSNA